MAAYPYSYKTQFYQIASAALDPQTSSTVIPPQPAHASPLTLSQTTTPQKQQANRFRIGLTSIFVIEYFGYTWLILVPVLHPLPPSAAGIALVAYFHLLFAIVLLCYVKCVTTDPGRVPRHWAFYRGDVAKRQRYCKECNAWKPERTHHCSSCSRCVLNMDHHCPWVDNCIGFYNRKFFMQLLFYGTLGLGHVTFHGLYRLVFSSWSYYVLDISPFLPPSYPHYPLALTIALCVFTLFSGFFFLALIQFLLFHTRLIAKNSTTIENMSLHNTSPSKYDLGTFRNFQQVFGRGHYLWWLPLDVPSTLPVGDGIRWG